MKKICRGCYKTLAVKTRFDIYSYLLKSHKDNNINDIVSFAHLRQPTVTFHINELEKAGLIKKQKKGREVIIKVERKCADCVMYEN
jgi:predicted transcriptional regulator